MNWLKNKKKKAQKLKTKVENKLNSTRSFQGTGHTLGSGEDTTSTSTEVEHKRPANKPRDATQDTRRQQMLEAAQRREQHINQKMMKKTTSAQSTETTSTTLAANTMTASFQACKLAEEQAIQASGFNPYQATFASAKQAKAQMAYAAPPPPPPVTQTNSTRQPLEASAIFDMSEGNGIEILIQQDPQVAVVAATTLLRMLRNILEHPTEEKYQRIRCSNPAFQKKVAQVPGSSQILRQSGFQLTHSDEDQQDYFVLVNPTHAIHTKLLTTIDQLEVAITHLSLE